MNAPARPQAAPVAAAPVAAQGALREPPILREEIRAAAALHQCPVTRRRRWRCRPVRTARLEDAPPRAAKQEMMNELRSMKGLIEERFGALAFMEKLQRQPGQAASRRSCSTAASRPH